MFRFLKLSSRHQTRTLKTMVISATGQDRPGAVHSLSSVISEHGGNLAGSRMAVLGSQFAVLLMASFPDTHKLHIEAFQRRMPGFVFNITEVEEPDAVPDIEQIVLDLKCQGPDQPGILKELTKSFEGLGINIRDLSTELSSAPFAGYPIFTVKAFVTVPPSMSIENLQKQLETIAESQGIEIECSKTNVPLE